MQVKATLIAQVNLHYEAENTFAKNLMIGTLKAALKNGVIEFYNCWQGFLEKQKRLKQRHKSCSLNFFGSNVDSDLVETS